MADGKYYVHVYVDGSVEKEFETREKAEAFVDKIYNDPHWVDDLGVYRAYIYHNGKKIEDYGY